MRSRVEGREGGSWWAGCGWWCGCWTGGVRQRLWTHARLILRECRCKVRLQVSGAVEKQTGAVIKTVAQRMVVIGAACNGSGRLLRT